MWKLVTTALNNYLNKKYSDLNGTLIVKSSRIPTKLNAFKECKIELYYHIPHKNILVYSFSKIVNISVETEDKQEEEIFTALMEQILENLNKIENEIIQNGRI